jgi:hypothetical protein
MNIPTTNAFSVELLDIFYKIGLERKLGSLTIQELEDISIVIHDFIVKEQHDDEPPF